MAIYLWFCVSPKCIESIINQLQPGVQVICVNDGTPDESANIARHTVKRFNQKIQDQFLFIDQENQGLSGARNTGLQYAIGEYVGFLDSDDKLLPQYIETILQTIKRADFDIIDFNLLTSMGELKQIRRGDKSNLESVFRAGLWYSCARVFRKDLFKKRRFTIGILFEDIALTPILYIEALKIIHINEPLYWYRINQEGITLNHSSENNYKTIYSFQSILNNYLEIYNIHNNKYLVPIIMQLFYLLCTTCSLRFSVFESFKFVNKYKPQLMKLNFKEKIKHNPMVNVRVYQFYLRPYAYLPFFKTAVYTRDILKYSNKN